MNVSKKHLISLFYFGFLVSSLPVGAQESQPLPPEQQAQSDALIQEAVEHYSAQRYKEAVECFKQANKILKEPELLFNIARSYEKMSNKREAIAWYERFLEAPGTIRDLRTRALDSIEVLHREIADEEALQKSKEVPAAPAAVAPQTDADTSTEAAPADKANPNSEIDIKVSGATAPQVPNSTGKKSHRAVSPMRIASYAILGSGCAALIVGGVFGGLSLGSQSDFKSAGYDPIRVQYREEMERNALIFDIAFFGGAALVAVGTSLFIVDVFKQKSANEVAVGKRRGENGTSADSAVRLIPTFVVGAGGLTGGLVGHF